MRFPGIIVRFPEGPVDRLATDVVVIHSSLGQDFIRVCPVHRWASVDSPHRRDLERCPHCALGEEDVGHERFDQLQRRLMPV